MDVLLFLLCSLYFERLGVANRYLVLSRTQTRHWPMRPINQYSALNARLFSFALFCFARLLLFCAKPVAKVNKPQRHGVISTFEDCGVKWASLIWRSFQSLKFALPHHPNHLKQHLRVFEIISAAGGKQRHISFPISALSFSVSDRVQTIQISADNICQYRY